MFFLFQHVLGGRNIFCSIHAISDQNTTVSKLFVLLFFLSLHKLNIQSGLSKASYLAPLPAYFLAPLPTFPASQCRIFLAPLPTFRKMAPLPAFFLAPLPTFFWLLSPPLEKWLLSPFFSALLPTFPKVFCVRLIE